MKCHKCFQSDGSRIYFVNTKIILHNDIPFHMEYRLDLTMIKYSERDELYHQYYDFHKGIQDYPHRIKACEFTQVIVELGVIE